MKCLLLTLPRHDPVTHYFYAYSEAILREAEKRGWNTEKCEGKGLARKEIESRLSAHRSSLAVFNGHGSNSTVEGNKDETILDPQNAHLLANVTAFVRACSSLVELGPLAVAKGCKAFIGYRRRFWFASTDGYMSRPLNDPIAQPVLETSNIVPLALLKGSTVDEAVEASHAAALKHALRLAGSSDPLQIEAFKYLMLNDAALAYEGNGNAAP